jgi:hypothetical protein
MLAAMALTSSGCLAVAAGCAAGGAAGYAYYQGRVARDYPAAFDPTWAAANGALADLGMPVIHTERNGDTASIESRTSEGQKVSILLDVQPPRAPSDPPLTRVSARVAVFGDQGFSKRYLEQVAFHLVPPHTNEPPLADPPPGQPPTAPPATGSPPLAPVPATPPPMAPTGWRPTPATPAPATKPASGR